MVEDLEKFLKKVADEDEKAVEEEAYRYASNYTSQKLSHEIDDSFYNIKSDYKRLKTNSKKKDK